VNFETAPLGESSLKPVWFDPLSPLGSAVRYIASLSPKYHWVGVYIWDGKKLKLGPYIGEPTEHTVITLGQGICGMAVEKNEDLNIPDVSKEKNYLSCSSKTKSELVVLVKNKKGQLLGQIDLDSHEQNAFSEHDYSEIKKIADQLGELWNAEKR
jgi:L-methionine (R)-S-oxide reductase